ncbi:type II toxin-antitoxin system VapC family toxin [soil metagenome]
MKLLIPDVNLLLYVTFEGFPQHDGARRWWEETLSENNPVGLTGPAVFGFLRISTHPRILSRPLTASEAGGLVTEWLARPGVTFLRPGAAHIEMALELISAIGTAGNLTTDIQIAATAIETGGTVCSNDSDFAKFEGVDRFNPLQR